MRGARGRHESRARPALPPSHPLDLLWAFPTDVVSPDGRDRIIDGLRLVAIGLPEYRAYFPPLAEMSMTLRGPRHDTLASGAWYHSRWI